MLYKIKVTQGVINFTIPEDKNEKWMNETELAGAIKLAGKINQNNSVQNEIPTLLIKVLESRQN